MSKKDYSLALKFTAKTSEVARKVRGLGRDIDMRLSMSNSRAVRGIGKIANSFSGVASAVTRIGGLIGGVFVGGLKMAFGLVGRISKGLMSLPMTGLKLLAVGGAAVFGAHKALGPAAEMERYKTQLDVLKKGHLYNFLTKSSAGKPFQMGETVQAGVLMEAFKIDSKKNLSTIMDAAAGFKKPLEEIVRMLGYARSGRTGEALESSARIGITRNDLKKFGIRFEKSGAATAETSGKLMSSMIGLMKSRFGGMANRIGTTTYEGAVSDLKDSLFRAFANVGKKILPFATKIVRDVSGVITSVGSKLRALPWDKWGAKLASGVHKAGNIINNLMDPKRRKDITKSISDGWNAIKGDIPKLGKALIIDSVALWAVTIRPKMIDIIGKAFTAAKGLLTDPLYNSLVKVWNYIAKGLGFIVYGLIKGIHDIVYSFLSIVNFLLPGPFKASGKAMSAFNKKGNQLANGAQKWTDKALIVASPDETARLKWEEKLSASKDAARNHQAFSETSKILAKMKKDSGVDKIKKKLTAEKEIKPIILKLLRSGPGVTGRINGVRQPLDKYQLASNAAMQKKAELFPNKYQLAPNGMVEKLVEIIPGLSSIKKEIDVFGREIFNSFSVDMKKNAVENIAIVKQVLVEMRKLNKNLGGS